MAAASCRILVVVLLVAPSVADARGRAYSAEESARRGYAVELLGISVGGIAPYLGDSIFEGDGRLNQNPAHFRARGREVGILRPTLTSVGVQVLTARLWHWFFVGGQVNYLAGDLDGSGALTARAHGLGNSLAAIGGGLHTGVVWSKSYFDLRGDVELGVRSFTIDITAFDSETCHAKGGATFPCQPTASALQFYAQPRLLGGVHVGPWLTIGAYGGIDLAGGVGWSAGAFAGLHVPCWAPDMLHADDMDELR